METVDYVVIGLGALLMSAPFIGRRNKLVAALVGGAAANGLYQYIKRAEAPSLVTDNSSARAVAVTNTPTVIASNNIFDDSSRVWTVSGDD